MSKISDAVKAARSARSSDQLAASTRGLSTAETKEVLAELRAVKAKYVAPGQRDPNVVHH